MSAPSCFRAVSLSLLAGLAALGACVLVGAVVRFIGRVFFGW